MSVFNSCNPFTGVVEYQQPVMSKSTVEDYLKQTENAFILWKKTSIQQRADYLHTIAKFLRQECNEIQLIITAEMGKLRQEALNEIEKCAQLCDYYAEYSEAYLQPKYIPSDAQQSYIYYQPIGCILAVMPWNFPFWQVFRCLVPNLMAGNTFLLKHAVNVPRCANKIADILQKAELPKGVFNILHIDNTATAEVIADYRIAGVSVTGSERAGRSIASQAGLYLKKVVLELGGSDPFIVLNNADITACAEAAAKGRFDNAGQTCIAAKRFIIQEDIAEQFIEQFINAAKKRQLGDPNDSATTLAPMARPDLRQQLHQQVTESAQLGARLLLGGIMDDSYSSYPATILDNITPNMPVYSQEVFGPVATIFRFNHLEEAIFTANNTHYGLGASIWTNNLSEANYIQQHLDCGSVFINQLVKSDARLPFGGTKQSGYGRELAEYGMHEFMNIKTVYIQ